MAKITIDSEKCVCCGDCAFICPVFVYNREIPSCQLACPIGTDIQSYLSLIAQEKFAEAFEVLSAVNPLPVTTGRVCTKPCETECVRAGIDEPVAICSLKRFVTDYEPELKKPAPTCRTRADVAIIGAGPAGLAAAHDLAILGYGVTVFEALPVIGGMLRIGIPDYRLPKSSLQKDIDAIVALGVEFRTDTPISENLTIDDLWRQGYKAILLTVGTQRGQKLGVPGEDGPRVIDCLSLLRMVNMGEHVSLEGNVLVIGGGNVAIDGARTAVRLGASKASLVCLESRAEMPAHDEQVKAAEEEGIYILPSRQCLQVLREDGAITGIECIELRSMRFESGKLITDPIAGSEHVLPANTVIVAIGQEPDISFITGIYAANGSGRVMINERTMETSQTGVFAAGDVVTGPSTVVDAMASGKRAALAIDAYLRGESLKEEHRPKPLPITLETEKIWGEIPKKQGQGSVNLPLKERICTFKEVDLGYFPDAAIEEAKRCLGCSVFSLMDVTSCCGLTCRRCMDYCWQAAITVSD